MATVAGVSVLAAGTVVAATGSAGAAAAATVTGMEAALPANAAPAPAVTVDSVSCASAGNCAAVGNYIDTSGNFQGLLLSEVSGTWATGTEAALPANAATAASSQSVTVGSVSCASAGNCTAVGSYLDSSGGQQGLLLSEVSGTWGTGTEAALPTGTASDPIVNLRSVSCASAGNCSAVGSYADSSGFSQGLLLSESSGTWGTGAEAALPAGAGTNPAVTVDSVSCASAGNCAAVGNYIDTSGNQQGLVLSQVSGTWATGAEAALPASAGTNPFATVDSVSCASAGNCTAVGGYLDSSGDSQGLLLSEVSGTWATGAEAALPADAGTNPDASLPSVSCASVGNCTAFGNYFDNSGGEPGVLLTQTSGTWATGAEVPLPANANSTPLAVPDAVSCASAANCSAVGVYADSTDHAQGLLVNQVSSACSGLTIANKAPAQTGKRGKPGRWSFKVSTHNCTGGALHAMTLRGSSAKWISGASATVRPSRGTVSIDVSHRGVMITWRGFSLASLAAASITVRVSGTVPSSAVCGSLEPISGAWSATGQTAANTGVSSGPSRIATIKITC